MKYGNGWDAATIIFAVFIILAGLLGMYLGVVAK